MFYPVKIRVCASAGPRPVCTHRLKVVSMSNTVKMHETEIDLFSIKLLLASSPSMNNRLRNSLNLFQFVAQTRIVSIESEYTADVHVHTHRSTCSDHRAPLLSGISEHETGKKYCL